MTETTISKFKTENKLLKDTPSVFNMGKRQHPPFDIYQANTNPVNNKRPKDKTSL